MATDAREGEIEAILGSIPDKTYYRIGEVARIAQVKPYVLRFWETEFNMAPSKSRSKQRMYRKKDIETILRIKQLLYQQGFTIKGARKKLAELARAERTEVASPPVTLSQIRTSLEELRALLD